MNELKRLLKPLYYKFMSMKCVMQRTIFAPLHGLSIPLNRNIKIASNVKFYNGTRIIYYDGSVRIGSNSEICCFSKFIVGGAKYK